ncbi:hypothetical protein RND81_11G059100 [Saponaria officinalis]|uniref:Uncharacterized protein n=1 Tax=Saponaria officinalis TaxID=3572 RepID=A0AAW1HI98_SAPOF
MVKCSGSRNTLVSDQFGVVLSLNCFGNLLEQLPSIIHGEFGLAAPHGPWIIKSLTASYRNGSSTGSGISVLMILSTSAASGNLSSRCKNNRICACGSPRF